MNKAIILARVSTERQSLDEQRDQLIKAAMSRGYDTDSIIVIQNKESGIKLSEEEREGINEMKTRIEADKSIDCVFIWELSRLSRKANVLYSVRDYLQSHRIQLICLNPAFVTFTDEFLLDTTANMIFGLFSSLAENEMQIKKDRFERAKLANVRENKFNGGPKVKFGYKLDESNKYVIDEDEAEIVRLIYHLCGDLRYSQRQIYNELKARGQKMAYATIRIMLIEECYTGKKCIPYGHTSKYERQYPAIVTEEQFAKCQAVRKMNFKDMKACSTIHIGGKVVKCPECGNSMVAHGGTFHASYRCNTHARMKVQDKQCYNTCNINIWVLDSLLWQVARSEWQKHMRQRSKDEQRELIDDSKNLRKKIETANKEMAKIETRLKRNRDAWILGDLGDQEYEANKILISEKKDALAASISSLSAHLKNNEEQLELIDQNKALSVDQIKEIINKTWRENDKQKMHEIVQKFITKAIVEYADEAQRDKLITLYLANGTEQHYIKKFQKREVHRVAYNKERREWIVIDDDVHFMYQYRNWD